MPVRGKPKPSFVGLFSGCGGFDLGFEQAGFRCISALDIDPQAVANHNANLSGNAAVCDLSQLRSVGLANRPDVVVAGPPCQGFSTLGQRAENDPRNSLLVRAVDLAIRAKPKVVLLENVSGVLAGAHHKYWTIARVHLHAAGFHTREFRVTGTDFGLPQIRKRVILLAAHRPLDHIALPTHVQNVSLKEHLNAVDQLPNHSPRWLVLGTDDYRIAKRIKPHQKLCNVRGGQRSVPTWEIPEVFGVVTDNERRLLCQMRQLRRQRRLRLCGDADPLTLADLKKFGTNVAATTVRSLLARGYIRKVGQRFDLAHTFNGKYRRLSWIHSAPTVDTRFGQPCYFLHPGENRGLSAREAARIQGFPDTYIFHGSLTTQFRLIGNAVPPPIARWFARAILEHVL